MDSESKIKELEAEIVILKDRSRRQRSTRKIQGKFKRRPPNRTQYRQRLIDVKKIFISITP